MTGAKAAEPAEVQAAVGRWVMTLRHCRAELASLRGRLVLPPVEEIAEMGERRPWDLATWIGSAIDCAVGESLATAIEHLEGALGESQEHLDQEWAEAQEAEGRAG